MKALFRFKQNETLGLKYSESMTRSVGSRCSLNFIFTSSDAGILVLICLEYVWKLNLATNKHRHSIFEDVIYCPICVGLFEFVHTTTLKFFYIIFGA